MRDVCLLPFADGHDQCCTCPAPINAVASLSPFCSFVSFHNDGDIYCWRTSDNAINGAAICACKLSLFTCFFSISKHFVASLCSQKSVNDLMALWFETESHFDIPDTNFTLPVTASGFNLPELNRSEDVIFFPSFLFSNSFCFVTIGAALKSRSFSSSGQKNVD